MPVDAPAAAAAHGGGSNAAGEAAQAGAAPSSEAQQLHAQPLQPLPPAEPQLLLRVAAIGHDCNLCMWDIPVPLQPPPLRQMHRHR